MKTILGLLFTVLVLASAGARADFYIGAGAYGTSVDEDGFEDSDVAPAVFLGWRPIELVGVELGYYDFGKFESQGSSLDANAVTLAGLLSMELGPVGVYAKAGVSNTSYKFSEVGNNFKDDSTDPFGGVGLTVDLIDKLYLYGEYLHFANDDAAVDVYGLGLRYSF
ncbi:MAG: outer membrane beta-barrel protein [Pedobacter sp.]|nr:outer membrane beta-barrel protein [Pedobacter sp.]